MTVRRPALLWLSFERLALLGLCVAQGFGAAGCDDAHYCVCVSSTHGRHHDGHHGGGAVVVVSSGGVPVRCGCDHHSHHKALSAGRRAGEEKGAVHGRLAGLDEGYDAGFAAGRSDALSGALETLSPPPWRRRREIAVRYDPHGVIELEDEDPHLVHAWHAAYAEAYRLAHSGAFDDGWIDGYLAGRSAAESQAFPKLPDAEGDAPDDL